MNAQLGKAAEALTLIYVLHSLALLTPVQYLNVLKLVSDSQLFRNQLLRTV